MSKVEVRMSSAVQVGQRKAVWRASVCAVAAIFGALVGQTLSAQTTSGIRLGTDALGIFQGLSADQQQQIMQRLGGGTGTEHVEHFRHKPEERQTTRSSSQRTSRTRGARAATKTRNRRRIRIRGRRRTPGRRSSKDWIRW